jgi:hypothetical protein
MWSETKNDCAGEDQQQFTGLDGKSVSRSVLRRVASCKWTVPVYGWLWEMSIVISRSPVTTEKQTDDFVCAVVVVICKVCNLVRLLWSFAATSYKRPIYQIINPNTVSS